MEIDPLSPDDHTLPGQPSYVSSSVFLHLCSVRATPISIDCPTFLNLSCVDLRYIALNSLTLHQLHPGRSRSLVRYHNRLHVNCLLGYLPLIDRSAGRNFPIAGMYSFHNSGECCCDSL